MNPIRLVSALLVLTVGCGHVGAPLGLVAGTPAGARDPLRGAAEAFYTARTVDEMEAAVERARELAPSSAIYHELAAGLEFLRANESGEFAHRVAALRDRDSDAAALHLELLDDTSWTLDERATAEALLAGLMVEHPLPAVRAKAAYKLAVLRHVRGDSAGMRTAASAVGLRLPLAVIGTWDNDQGKGFDVPFPPEDGVDLAARYAGSLLEIGWRTDPPLTPGVGTVDLGGIMNPKSWALAYAATAVRVAEAGDFELRVLTSVPTKVWVNGVALYGERRIERTVFDQLVLPVHLPAGVSRVLIKTAQNTGTWMVAARLTAVGGGQPTGVVSVAADAEISDGAPPGPMWTTEQLIERRLSDISEGSARRMFHKLFWSRMLGTHNLSVAVGDELAQRFDGTIAGRYALAGALWNHGERGRTADLLAALALEAGDRLPFLRLQHARFLQQEDLIKDSRETLLALRDAHPDLAAVWVGLAALFSHEGWLEDKCSAHDRAAELRPRWLEVVFARARCRDKLGFELDAIDAYEGILEELPNNSSALRKLYGIASGNEQLRRAEALALRLTEVQPNQASAWTRLAEARRRRHDDQGASRALQRAVELDPDSSKAYKSLGALAYRQGDTATAVRYWQEALVRDPSDEKLANRLAYLAPEGKEPWEQDIPNEDAIAAAVASAPKVVVKAGANVLDLLDHEVSRINADGSTVSVVTQVMHAVNEAGRDSMTQLRLRSGGRIRVFHAYAVDPDGKRIPVSSIRDRVARFRGLKIGSTVVLQYRHDAPAVGYLARHVARGWWFQGVARQMELSQWIVWAPEGARFHEWSLSEMERTEEKRDGVQRLSWTGRGIDPVIAEPYMPTLWEVGLNMMVSTVPDWGTFLEWEKALLHEAFRESSEVQALAQSLFAGLDTKQAKIDRLHAYLMDEIRYQQDYENHIAGVKPHPATVVVKRAYGDCKDKAVLFITVARLAGIDAHFAMVRTRSRGPLRRDVPMQQFNHAIVYVPAQEGVAEGRFYDPTADALDVSALPLDDAGVTALVLDPVSGEHRWLEVPYQGVAQNHRHVRTKIELATDGSATGRIEIEAVGHEASVYRRLARNQQQFRQAMQMFVSHNIPGATVSGQEATEVENLSKPALITGDLVSPAHGRLEGSLLKVTIPRAWSPDSVFRLAERKYPLVLGSPVEFRWRSEIEIPEGATVSRLPSNGEVTAACYAYSRKVTRKRRTVIVDQRLETRCERIPVDTYGQHRELTEQLIRLYKEELTVQLAATAAR